MFSLSKYIHDTLELSGLDDCDYGPYLDYVQNILYIDKLIPVMEEYIAFLDMTYRCEYAVDQREPQKIKYVNGEAVNFNYQCYCANKPSWDHTAHALQYFEEYTFNGVLYSSVKNFKALDECINGLTCVKAQAKARAQLDALNKARKSNI